MLRRAPLAACAWLAALLAAPGAAHAGPGDYDVANPEWNGLSELASLAEAQGLTVESLEELDWEDLEPGDFLFILYPTEKVNPTHLASFVRGGGRVLLADDHGHATHALARLGILRRPATGVSPTRWHEDNVALPVANAWEDGHPLAAGAEELVTNHPAVFEASGFDVVYGFGKGEAVVVAGELGDGRFVALSDPSVLINGMLAFDGNLAFAANLIRWLTPDAARDEGEGRLIILTHAYHTIGSPPDVLGDDVLLGSVNKVIREFGKWLDELNDYIASESAMRALGVLGAFALLVLGAFALPFQRGAERLDGGWTRARDAERVDFERLMEHYDDPRWNGTYAYPAAVLREGVDARLGALVGVAEPLSHLQPIDLIQRLERRAGPRAATALHEIIDALRVLPGRAEAQAPWGARFVSRREFDRVYDGVQALERALGNG